MRVVFQLHRTISWKVFTMSDIILMPSRGSSYAVCCSHTTVEMLSVYCRNEPHLASHLPLSPLLHLQQLRTSLHFLSQTNSIYRVLLLWQQRTLQVAVGKQMMGSLAVMRWRKLPAQQQEKMSNQKGTCYTYHDYQASVWAKINSDWKIMIKMIITHADDDEQHWGCYRHC